MFVESADMSLLNEIISKYFLKIILINLSWMSDKWFGSICSTPWDSQNCIWLTIQSCWSIFMHMFSIIWKGTFEDDIYFFQFCFVWWVLTQECWCVRFNYEMNRNYYSQSELVNFDMPCSDEIASGRHYHFCSISKCKQYLKSISLFTFMYTLAWIGFLIVARRVSSIRA